MKYRRKKNKKDYTKKIKELELERFLKRKDKILSEEGLENISHQINKELDIAISKG